MSHFMIILQITNLHIIQIAFLFHCTLQISFDLLFPFDDLSIFFILKLDLSTLNCILWLSLLFHFKLVSKLIKVSFSISLKFEFHVPSILFEVSKIFSFLSLVLDLLFFVTIFKISHLKCYELIHSRSWYFKRIHHLIDGSTLRNTCWLSLSRCAYLLVCNNNLHRLMLPPLLGKYNIQETC